MARGSINIGGKNYDSAVIYQQATGTGTAITLQLPTLVNLYSITFIANANNNGSATTINGIPLYKPNTTSAPTLTAGKAYTVWYNQSGNCFFLKASAEGNAVASDVLASKTFSNDNDTGLVGTMPNRGAITNTITTQGGQYTIPDGYHSGSGKVTASFSNLSAENVKNGVNIGGVVGNFEALSLIASATDIQSGSINSSEEFIGVGINVGNSATITINSIVFNVESKDFTLTSTGRVWIRRSTNDAYFTTSYTDNSGGANILVYNPNRYSITIHNTNDSVSFFVVRLIG